MFDSSIFSQAILNDVLVIISNLVKTFKLYGPFLWMGFNSLKAKATLRRQFFFKFPEIPGAHFIDLGRMKG